MSYKKSTCCRSCPIIAVSGWPQCKTDMIHDSRTLGTTQPLLPLVDHLHHLGLTFTEKSPGVLLDKTVPGVELWAPTIRLGPQELVCPGETGFLSLSYLFWL